MNLKNKNLFCQQSFINGKWYDSKDKISVFNPSDDSLIGHVPNGLTDAAKQAIDAALAAKSNWENFRK